MLELTTMVTTVLILLIFECTMLRTMPPLTSLYKSNHSSSKPGLTETSENVNLTVVLYSFDVAMTALAIAEHIKDQEKFPHLDPKLAYYHTTAWRWFLRQLSLHPDIYQRKFFELHKVWRKRFYYEDVFVPRWLQKLLVWVDDTTWDKEYDMTQLYNTYAKRVFAKYPRYPPKKFVSEESYSNSTSSFDPGQFKDDP